MKAIVRWCCSAQLPHLPISTHEILIKGTGSPPPPFTWQPSHILRLTMSIVSSLSCCSILTTDILPIWWTHEQLGKLQLYLAECKGVVVIKEVVLKRFMFVYMFHNAQNYILLCCELYSPQLFPVCINSCDKFWSSIRKREVEGPRAGIIDNW